MSNWREISAFNSSSETNKSVKLLKCIKFGAINFISSKKFENKQNGDHLKLSC